MARVPTVGFTINSSSSFPYSYDLSDPAVIAFNQQGQIAPVQRQAFTKGGKGNWITIISRTIVTLGCVIVPVLALHFFPHPPILVAVAFAVLGVIAVYLAFVWVAFININNKVNKGYIGQGQGEVVWKGNQYQAYLGGRKFKTLLFRQPIELAPGSYHFYFVKGSKLLLSAQRLPDVQSFEAAMTQSLAKVFAFKPNDLDANRQGQLSPRQHSKLMFHTAYSGVATVIGLGVGVLIGLWLYNQGVFNNLANFWQQMWNRQNPTLIGFMGLIGLLALIWGFVSLFDFISNVADLRSSSVRMISGLTTKKYKVRVSAKHSSVRYFYVVGDSEIRVSQKRYNALVPNHFYQIYTLPRSGQIMSIEATPVIVQPNYQVFAANQM